MIYEQYAAVYDLIGQGSFGARQAAWALAWLAARGAAPSRVLDLACGAGDAALVFAAAGCTVVGVDRSRPMLELARGKARDAKREITFIEGDIRDLEPRTKNQATIANPDLLGSQFSALSSHFDVATCFYDSLNYLTEDGDLDRVFAGASATLRLGGYLVFDVNTVAEYATWDERDQVTYDGRNCFVYNQLSYDPPTKLAHGRIVWFVREIERWWRGEETHIQRAWDNREILAALDRAGLRALGRWGVDGAPIADAADEPPRAIYIAWKETA